MTEIQIEKDSVDTEDVLNIHDFCKPEDSILNQALTLGIIYKRSIFDAWVKQPSPCCGAASIAGSLNALLKIHRSSEKAFNHSDMLSIHKLLFMEKIQSKLKTFQRKVGCDVLTSVLLPLSTIIESLIKENAGSKDDTANARAISADSGTTPSSSSFKANLTMKKTLLFSAMEQFIQQYEAAKKLEEGESVNVASNDAEKTKQQHIQQFETDALKIFIELIKTTISSRKNDSATDMADTAGTAENDNESSARDTVDEAAPVTETEPIEAASTTTTTTTVLSGSASLNSISATNNGTTSKLKSKFNKVPSYANKSAASNSTGSGDGIAGTNSNTAEWSWSDDLMELFKFISGYNKLNATPYPNTGPIGNVSVLQAVYRVSEYCGFGTCLKGKLFMGRRTGTNQKASASSRLEVPLSVRDDEDTITSQWNALKSMFARQDSVLLFHLTNHYSLIFALREWVIESPSTSSSPSQPPSVSSSPPSSITVVRQLLCARKGQRPTAWMDFTEAREIMLNWEGYKIISIQLQPQAVTTITTGTTGIIENVINEDSAVGVANASAIESQVIGTTEMNGNCKKYFTQRLHDEMENIEFQETMRLIHSFVFV